MNKQRNHTVLRILEQLLPIVLAVVCVLVMTLNTQRAYLPVPLPLTFEGEYSFDGGESWEMLTPASDLSTNRGDLLLRGHFDNDFYENAVLYLYRDHFAVTISHNGQIHYQSIHAELLTMGEAGKKYFADNCGREWVMVAFPEGLSMTDTIELHLQKTHGFIDRNAYRNLLTSCCVGPVDTTIVETHLQPHATPWLTLGGLLILVGVMILGAALAAVALQTAMMRSLYQFGFLVFFFGGYLILDTVTLPFWNDTQVFNTYARTICSMLAAYWLGLCIRDLLTGRRHKLAGILTNISFGLNTVLILPSFLGAWAIYDTVPLWAVAQMVFTVLLLAAVMAEVLTAERKNRINLYPCVLILVTVLMDFAGIGSSMYSHGTCTKIAAALIFVVHGFRTLRRVLVDYQDARRAKKLEKELEESRIAIMLSQMQPHFVHNILNVIYYMCGKNPAAAQTAISKFSDHLRNNLEALSQKELIPFRKELDHIRTYLELEQIRFGEELSIVYDIEEDSFLLPVLSIQPLVENAVKHGIAKKRGGGVVTIASRQTEQAYQITVADNGVGFDADRYMEDGKIHVGLMNVRQLLSGRVNATVEISSAPGSGTTVTVTIPRKKVVQ